jgi:hypothetical protein
VDEPFVIHDPLAHLSIILAHGGSRQIEGVGGPDPITDEPCGFSMAHPLWLMSHENWMSQISCFVSQWLIVEIKWMSL